MNKVIKYLKIKQNLILLAINERNYDYYQNLRYTTIGNLWSRYKPQVERCDQKRKYIQQQIDVLNLK